MSIRPPKAPILDDWSSVRQWRVRRRPVRSRGPLSGEVPGAAIRQLLAEAVQKRARLFVFSRCRGEHELQQQKIIRCIPFPGDLKGKYQIYTQADLTALRAARYAAPFLTVEQGVSRYIHQLLAKAGS